MKPIIEGPAENTRSGPLIVIGDHPAKVDDFKVIRTSTPTADLMAANRGAHGIPEEVQYIATLHPQYKREYFVSGNERVFTQAKQRLNIPRDKWYAQGIICSGLFAAAIGFAMGYSPIILTGMRLEGWYGNNANIESWTRWKPVLQDAVLNYPV